MNLFAQLQSQCSPFSANQGLNLDQKNEESLSLFLKMFKKYKPIKQKKHKICIGFVVHILFIKYRSSHQKYISFFFILNSWNKKTKQHIFNIIYIKVEQKESQLDITINTLVWNK